MIRHILLMVFLFSMACFSEADANDVTLKIISPQSEIVAFPGQSFNVTIEMVGGVPESYRGGWIGVNSNIPIELDDFEISQSSYVFPINLPENIKPGRYFIVGFASTPAEGQVNFSDKIAVNIIPISGYEYKIENDFVLLSFIGDSRKVEIIGVDEGGTSFPVPPSIEKTLKYDSGDKSIATVSPEGWITAVKPGKVAIRATIEGKELAANIIIEPSKIRGDLVIDGQIDMRDLQIVKASMGKRVETLNDGRDLNGDGKIDALDLRILTTLCTRPRCATE